MGRFQCKHRKTEQHGPYRWCATCGAIKHDLGRGWRLPIRKRKAFRAANPTPPGFKRCAQRLPTTDGGFWICARKAGHHGAHKVGRTVWSK